ncbi:MAG: MerR family transcriptional regulator [Alphaproteobacteria bacterium]|nr:MerR family transcriptional regulator [Alphaproteobacteria bacterium]
MGEKLFKSIGDVSKELDLPAHILRFWEDNFKNVRPIRRSGNRRYYHVKDVETLHRIKELLYKQKYTIKGAQKVLRQEALPNTSYKDDVTPTKQTEKVAYPDLRNVLSSVLNELKALKKVLNDS